MTDQPEADSDLRRRAAWLLGMLALVAVLFVLLLTTLLDSSGSKSNNNAGPDDTFAATSGASGSRPATTVTSSPGPTRRSSTSSAKSSTSSPPASSSTTAAAAGSGTKTCPTSQKCALEGDYGNAVDAINAYRTQHGKKAVPGTVSKAAQDCAKSNGGGCKGGWAESQVPSLDGGAAVKKVQRLGKLLDPMTSFSVGWAYDPGSKQYYFAVIRKT